MKKAIAATLTAILIFLCAGCAQPKTNAPPSTLPKMDGSTACIPLAIKLYETVSGMSQEEAENAVNFSTTWQSYYKLYEKECDLLLVYEADESTLNEEYGIGNEFEYIPIGLDALVFITNSSNPVESLATEQIVGIYSGRINVWSEVGGASNSEILAFQRPPGSGSQNLMEKLVMKDVDMAWSDAPSRYVISDMMGLISTIASYQNEGNALGYSVYYYVNNMYKLPEIKTLAVDGVAPSNETIQSREYPFVNEFYAVIRKDEPENSNARQLAQWLTTPEGQKLLSDAGYVPISI